MLQNGKSDSPEVACDTSNRTSGVQEEGSTNEESRFTRDRTHGTEDTKHPSPSSQTVSFKDSPVCRVSHYCVNQEPGEDSDPTWSETSVGEEPGRRKRRRQQTASQRRAANTRERKRMCHLNQAFILLKNHLPNVRDKNRLSRIQTLRAAISYIQYLILESKDMNQT